MFSRTVSLVLIAAIAACPMWCGAGLCHGQCCSQGSSEASTASPLNETQNCCHREESGSEHGNNQQGPRNSSQTSCQGICGGAVLEKTVEVDDSPDGLILALADAYAAVATRIVERSHRRFEQTCCGSGSNHGRFLRTLHMSFLC
jgi:hypothetical protein